MRLPRRKHRSKEREIENFPYICTFNLKTSLRNDGNLERIFRDTEWLLVGMAHDHPAAGNARFPHLQVGNTTAQTTDGHQVVDQQGQRFHGRRVTVWRAGNGTGGNHWHRQHRRCSHRGGPGRSGCRAVVLALGRVWHRHQVQRGPAGHQVPRQGCRRPHAGRPDVRPGARPGLEVARRAVRAVHRAGLLRHRQHGAGQRHLDHCP